MLSSDSVATATENASRLGYDVTDLHMASHDYQEVIQHTHTHTHPHTPSLTESFNFFLTQIPPLFQREFKRTEWKFQTTESKHDSRLSH